MVDRKTTKEDWELQQLIDDRIESKLTNYDERLWERFRAYIAEHVSPKLQQLFFGYGLLKWVAGLVGALAIGTIWQIVTSVVNSVGGGT
jgi:hypothetical protein